MTTVILVTYALIGCLVGAFTTLALDSVRWCPDEGKPALAFASGLLWPLAIVVSASYAIWLGGRAIGRSFVALWRAWRPAQVTIPRATAKYRTP